MKVAVVGATGMVGRIMLRVLEERNFPVSEIIPVASSRSIGKKVQFKSEEYDVVSIEDAIDRRPDIALFSAGGGTSLKYAPRFAEVGTIVIDNSSAWRMDPDVPLVVPEINTGAIAKGQKIIANPNCSTIQMVVALNPLHEKYGIEQIIVSTYQSVTGTGQDAFAQLMAERNGTDVTPVYPHPIDMNCIPHCDVFMDNGYTKEEMKLVHETRKIFDDQSIRITATAVRVPVIGGHSESVFLRLKKTFSLSEIINDLKTSPGLVVLDNPAQNEYPMPLLANNKDDVFVGRIRKDLSDPLGLNLWIVSDNLRKGAATNAVQIAEFLLSQ